MNLARPKKPYVHPKVTRVTDPHKIEVLKSLFEDTHQEKPGETP